MTEFFGGHQWISILHLNGKFQKAIHLSFKGYMVFRVLGAYSLPDGTFLVHVVFAEPSRQVEDYFHHVTSNVLLRINEKGEIIQEMVKKTYVTNFNGSSWS